MRRTEKYAAMMKDEAQRRRWTFCEAVKALRGLPNQGGRLKILAMQKEVPGVREDDFKPHLKEEAARVWELYRLGVFRELYFRKDRPGAVLILECADIEEAGHLLKTLPLVRAAL